MYFVYVEIFGRLRARLVDVVERETFFELIAQEQLSLDGRVEKQTRCILKAGREQLQKGRVALLFCFLDELVDFLLARNQHWMNDFFVQQTRAARRRRQYPQYEQYFNLIVERKPRKEYVQKCLQRREQRKYYPVHHPFDLAQININHFSVSFYANT